MVIEIPSTPTKDIVTLIIKVYFAIESVAW